MAIDLDLDLGPCTSWVVRVAEPGHQGTSYTALTWAEVDARVRQILEEADIPAGPTSLIEGAMLDRLKDKERDESTS
jgi:hypothetical protein